MTTNTLVWPCWVWPCLVRLYLLRYCQHSAMCCRQLRFPCLALALDRTQPQPSPNPAQVLFYSKMVYGLLSFPFLLFVTPMVARTLALTPALFRTPIPNPSPIPSPSPSPDRDPSPNRNPPP